MSGSGKHILILTPGFAANENDKTCIPVMQNYVQEYHRIYPGDTISVIAFQYPFTARAYMWHGINIYPAGGRNRRYPLRFLTWMRVYRQFRKIHRSRHVDVIHSFYLSECTFLGAYIARLHHLQLIATAMGQDCAAGNRFLKMMNLENIFVASLSDFMSDHLFINSGKRVNQIIPFGEVWRPEQNEETARTIDILGVGSIVPVKNYGLFIEVISALQEEFPTLVCRIIGNRPDEHEYQEILAGIKREELDNILAIEPEMMPEEVLASMRRSKILLHTSLFEGQCMVYSEALASGMTVVCAPVGRIYPDKMLVCDTREKMVDAISRLLRQNTFDFEPVHHEKMEDTALQYHHLYHA